MSYVPSLSDIEELQPSKGGSSYKPSLLDIEELQNQNKQDKLNIGSDRPNLNNVRDILGGIAKGSQNIASLLGEGGQKIASLLTGGYAPQVNVREELGLGEKNPVDLGKMISSNNPNPYLQTGGQYGLPSLVGSTSILGQALAQGLNQAAQSQPENRLREGAFGSLLGGAGIAGSKLVGNVLKTLPAIFSKMKGELNPDSISKLAHDAYSEADSAIANAYNNIFSEAEKRGIKNIPIDKKLFFSSKKYLPKTDVNKELINKSMTGDFSELRKLQSDLGKKGHKYLNSPLGAERDRGEEMLDVRNKINNAISDFFEKNGHQDLNLDLKNANLQYKNFREIYHSKGVPQRIFDKNIKESPKNILDLLSKNSLPMNRFRDAHPEISKRVKFNNQLNALRKKGLYTAAGSGIGAGAYELSRFIKDLLDKKQ